MASRLAACPHLFVRRTFVPNALRQRGSPSYPLWLAAARRRVHRPHKEQLRVEGDALVECDICLQSSNANQTQLSSSRDDGTLDKVNAIVSKAILKHESMTQPTADKNSSSLPNAEMDEGVTQQQRRTLQKNLMTILMEDLRAMSAAIGSGSQPNKSLKSCPPHQEQQLKYQQYPSAQVALFQFARSFSSLLRRSQTKMLMSAQVTAGRFFPPFLMTDKALHDALHISRFAAAAYGPAFFEGFHSSIPCNAALQLETFDPFVVVSHELHRYSAEMLLGLQKGNNATTIQVVALRTSDQPNVASYSIFVDHTHRWIVVAFRGTTSTGDMITDLKYKPQSVATSAVAPGGDSSSSRVITDGIVAPEGFMDSVRGASAEIERLLSDLEGNLPAGYETVFTGHSLGAIQANLYFVLHESQAWMAATSKHEDAEVRSHQTARKRRVVAFAPAPCVALSDGGAGAARDFFRHVYDNDLVHNFCYGHDIIPRLQVHSLYLFLHHHQHGAAAAAAAGPAQDTDKQEDEVFPKYHFPGKLIWIDPEENGGRAELPSSSRFRLLPHTLFPLSSSASTAGVDDEEAAEQWNAWNALLPISHSLHHHFLTNCCRSFWSARK